MAIEVLYDPDRREGCLCSASSGEAFGPVLTNLESREQLEQFAQSVAQFLTTGGDPDEVPALLDRLQKASVWPTDAALQCLHCDSIVDPLEIRNAMNAASWHLFEPTVRAACPDCGQGDGDFQEVQVCGQCGEPIDDVLHHANSCGERGEERTTSKPPLPSVRAFVRRSRRRLA